ncbi:putative ORFan [Tupanvirus deep ocean]|uniref:ORFan n=2 Tax=Tupanvirus TaxID=2094720 RepID=A0AC62A9P2_9VIRU|nr:putative ORFan [Tupanvirus deep ocean]QKU34363.1 putative ORFan [Tupanvirus deep ocean]
MSERIGSERIGSERMGSESIDLVISNYLAENNLKYLSGVGIFGNQSVGKSSIINLYAGKAVAQVSSRQCTKDLTYYQTGTALSMVDFPGFNGELVDGKTFHQLHSDKINKMAGVIFVTTADDISKGFVKLFESVARCTSGEILVIINKFDEQIKESCNAVSSRAVRESMTDLSNIFSEVNQSNVVVRENLPLSNIYQKLFTPVELLAIRQRMTEILDDFESRLAKLGFNRRVDYVFVQSNIHEIHDSIMADKLDDDEDLFPFEHYLTGRRKINARLDVREEYHHQRFSQTSNRNPSIADLNKLILTDLLEIANRDIMMEKIDRLFTNAKLYMLSNIINNIYQSNNSAPIDYLIKKLSENVYVKEEYKYEEVTSSCFQTYRELKTGIRTIFNQDFETKLNDFNRLMSSIDKASTHNNDSFYHLPVMFINDALMKIVDDYFNVATKFTSSDYMSKTIGYVSEKFVSNMVEIKNKNLPKDFLKKSVFIKIGNVVVMVSGDIKFDSVSCKFYFTHIRYICKLVPMLNKEINHIQCAICCNDITNKDKYIIDNCNHGAFCIECKSVLDRCPMCRTNASGWNKVYI